MFRGLFCSRYFARPLGAPRHLAGVALVGLLAVALSSPASAATFTMAELEAGQEFTIGSLRFFDWNFDDVGSTVDPTIITVETVESESVPGFIINGNEELVGDLTRLDYQYTIATTDEALVVGAALLWLTDSFATSDASIDVTLQDEIAATLFLEVGVNEGIENLSDAAVFGAPASEIPLRSVVEMSVPGTGAAAVGSYSTLFTVVPEPSTGLLVGFGLAGLVLLRRRDSTA